MSEEQRELKRLPKLESHPHFTQIKRDLVDGKKSKAQIAREYDVHYNTISNYARKKLLPAAAKRRRVKEKREGESVLMRVKELANTAQQVVDSCADYLRDPEDEERFIVAPTAREIQVIYWKRDSDGEIRRHRDRLQNLLDKAAGEQGEAFEVEDLHANSPDPRKLLLEGIERTEKVMQLLAKIEGSIQNVNQQINIVNMPEWEDLKQAILEATEGYPEVREHIGRRLREISSAAKQRD